jgi:hypothetical protein
MQEYVAAVSCGIAEDVFMLLMNCGTVDADLVFKS